MALPGPGDRQDRVAARMGVSESAAGARRQHGNAAATSIGALQPADRTGAAYVKLGQLLSTRPDLLSDDYIAALSRLQADVPPGPGRR